MSALALANPLEPFFPMLWHFHAAVCLTVAGATLFLYDWAITFSDEVQHIWRGRMNTVKGLYLYNRIVTPLILAVDLYDKGGLATNLTPTASLLFDGWGTVLSFASIHWIVALRVWTLYGRSRGVLFFFILLFAAYFISTAIIWGFAGAEISKTIYPSPLLVRMCYTVIPSWMWYLWIPSLGFETIIFVLTVYKAWQHWQTDVNTPILTVLYRDGFMYFFVISCLSLVNLFIWLWAPHSLAILLKYFSLPAVNVAAFRLVLDLRTTAGLHSRPTLRRSNKSEPIHISFDNFELSPRGGNLDHGRSTGRTPGGSMAFLSFDDHVDPSDAIEEGRSMSLEHDNPKRDIYPPYDHQALHGPRTAPLASSAGFQPLHDVPYSAMSPTRQFALSPTSPLETDALMSSSPVSVGMRRGGNLSPISVGSLRIPAELISAIEGVSAGAGDRSDGSRHQNLESTHDAFPVPRSPGSGSVSITSPLFGTYSAVHSHEGVSSGSSHAPSRHFEARHASMEASPASPSHPYPTHPYATPFSESSLVGSTEAFEHTLPRSERHLGTSLATPHDRSVSGHRTGETGQWAPHTHS